MKFRILLRSFNNDLIDLACKQLRSLLIKTDCELKGVVSLPTKIKRFCVLRSPHIDKDSREHFELRIYKRFIDRLIKPIHNRLWSVGGSKKSKPA